MPYYMMFLSLHVGPNVFTFLLSVSFACNLNCEINKPILGNLYLLFKHTGVFRLRGTNNQIESIYKLLPEVRHRNVF